MLLPVLLWLRVSGGAVFASRDELYYQYHSATIRYIDLHYYYACSRHLFHTNRPNAITTRAAIA
jgi:hypothetical protein